MFERNLEKDLKNWKDSQIRKVLILRGARQVGKTSLIRKFGSELFDELIEINLESPEQRKWFEGVSSIADFAKRVELYLAKTLIDGKSLLFIDEVQESSEIMNLLRFFAEERPQLHVVVAGSLLEARINQDWSVPVGRVEYLYLYPLSFFEYLSATENKQWRQYLESVTLGEKIVGGDYLKTLFLEYMMQGGLPEVVVNVINNPGSIVSKEIQGRLQSGYFDDIGKYARQSEKKYLELVLDMAPKLAGSIYKYENMGESGYRGREVAEAVDKLEKIMLLNQVEAINTTSLPILSKLKRAKKMIYLDTGLVNYANKTHEAIFAGNYEGRLMEQIVGQTLVAQGSRTKIDLYYWAKDKDQGSAEVDFAMQIGNKIVAFEVKSGQTRSMRSLFSMIDDGGALIIPVRVGWEGWGMRDYLHNKKRYKILSIPFYLLERFREFV